MKKVFLFLIIYVCGTAASAQLKLSFPAKDGIKVTADWYPVSSQMPVILLCHQDGYSRGEYAESALRLNKFGFNCMAIDQRVGKSVNGIENETSSYAREKKMNPVYADAEMDMLAAVDYLYEKYQRPIIVLGSSYSASLALKIAAENPKVSAAIVFSPGEYFNDKKFVATHIQALNKPLFATSSLEEADGVTDLLKDVNSRIKIQYIPSSKGEHGSKVLWTETEGNQEYWIALMSFLDRIKS